MSFDDRLKGALSGFIRASQPGIDYLAFYPAKVVSQASDLSLELKPDDARLPSSFSKVPIRHGIPNITVKVSPGARVLIAFENGDPDKPIAALWESGTVTELVFNGTTIKIGGDGATEKAVLGDTLKSLINNIFSLMQSGLTTASGGGPVTVADPSAIVSINAALTGSTFLSTKVKVGG